MNKIILTVGEGLGNVIEVLPLAKTLKYNGIHFDVLNLSNCSSATVSWIFDKYAKVIEGSFNPKNYNARIELATTKNNLSHYERIEIPAINDLNKQFIYTAEKNEIEVYLLAAKDIGIEPNTDAYNVEFKELSKVKSFDFIVHNGSSLHNKLEWERKLYPGMKDLIEILIKKGYSVGCIGSKEEYIAGENMTGLDIHNSASLIDACKYFISNDTGTYHLAAALKATGCVLFTATSQIKNYNHNFHKTITPITAKVDCQPCQYKSDWLRCSISSHNNWKCRNIPQESILKEIRNAEIF